MSVEGPRQPQHHEAEALVKLLDDIFDFSRYDRNTMVAAMRRPMMETGRGIFVDGQLVSYIYSQDIDYVMHGCRTRLSSLGGVSTHPDFRGQNFATKLLFHQFDRMRENGVRWVIISGDRGLYMRNGATYASVSYDAKITREQAPAASANLRLRQVTLDQWPELAPLYEAEVSHFVRPADLEQNLVFWWDCVCKRIYAIEDNQKLVAYVAIAENNTIYEHAGARAAIIEALPLLFKETGSDSIGFAVLGHDTDLLERLRKLGVDVSSWWTASGTFRLINLPGLMEDLHDYLAARLPAEVLAQLSFVQDENSCTFSLGAETFSCDLAVACRLVFGAGKEVPEVPGELGRVLAKIYPLPTVQPGLNYV
jgi:predicted N-acetyltransferase YhbS